MVGDYEKYRTQRNITYIGICTSRTADPKSFGAEVDQFKLKPFANMLDANAATQRAYDIPPNASAWMVVIDADGKIAYDASNAWKYSGGPDAGRWCHEVAIERAQKASPGILGLDKVPSEYAQAAHLFDLQQFALLDDELKRVKASFPNSYPEVLAQFAKRIDEERAQRIAGIEALATSKPLQAYRDAICFVLAFPKAPERAHVNDLGRSLLKDKTVKRELQAEDAYRQTLVPLMRRTTTLKDFEDKLQPAGEGFARAFKDTEFCATAVAAITAHGDAIKHPNH